MVNVTKSFLVGFFILMTACQVNNSNSGDDVRFSDGAAGIFQNRCSQCHNYASLSASSFVEQGLVIPGSPSTSPLFKRIRGSAVGGAEDMPPQGVGDITAEEVQIISAWIENL